MNILILGGTHLTGTWVVKSLYELGHQITIFNRGKTQSNLPPEINRVYGDRRYIINYIAELQKLSPDVVIDMNAMTESIFVTPELSSKLIKKIDTINIKDPPPTPKKNQSKP
jgi:nucleoside-diphosphate-sugar epimerase